MTGDPVLREAQHAETHAEPTAEELDGSAASVSLQFPADLPALFRIAASLSDIQLAYGAGLLYDHGGNDRNPLCAAQEDHERDQRPRDWQRKNCQSRAKG